MTTRSARPDLLDQTARLLRADATRLSAATDLVRTALAAYIRDCPDLPLAVTSTARSDQASDGLVDLSLELFQVAEAFRSADTDSSPRLAVTTDRVLSRILATNHLGVSAALTAPTRAARRRGRELARDISAADQRNGAFAAASLLAGLTQEDRFDPELMAAVFNGVGAHRIADIVEQLATRSPGGPQLRAMADAWAVATSSLDLSPRGSQLDRQMLDELLAEPLGRNVLRALAGTSGVRSGGTYLRRMRSPLLVDSARGDADLSGSYRLLTRGGDSDPDRGFLNAVGLTPGAGRSLLEDKRLGPTYERRVRWLLDQGLAAQRSVVAIIGELLDDPALQPGATTPRARSEALRATYDWVSRHPKEVSEPLAQLLADSLATDPALFTARVDTVPGGTPTAVLQAVTRFERPWLTALLALEAHSLERVRETLHQSTAVRLTALDDLGVLTDALQTAADRSDRPGPGSATFFRLLRFVVGPLVGAATTGTGPVIGTVVKAGVNQAISKWQAATAEEPSTRGDRTRHQREAFRRRVWVVIAEDPELSANLVWGIDGPGGVDVTGSRIRSVVDLVELDGSGEDLDELAAWAAAQPAELQALVAGYLGDA